MKQGQKGNMLGWLLLLLLISAGVQLGRLLPHYFEHRTLVSVVGDMATDPELTHLTPAQFRQQLRQRLARNGIRDFDSDALVVARRVDGLEVALDYEVREPLFGNAAIVLHFEEQFAHGAR